MSTGNIGKIKASRVNNVPNVESYLGEKGILFFNFANGVIRLSDGITPGGVPIPYTVATDSVIGGIKAGPGANISVDGTLTIDTAGLPLSIGNLEISDTTISALNANNNLNLLSNGTGEVNLIGNVHIHPTAGWPGNDSMPLFEINNTGFVSIFANNVPGGTSGALNIVGSADRTYMPVNGAGGMLHITGNPDTSARITVDGYTTSPTDPQPSTAIGAGLLTMRAARGTPTSPLPMKANDHLGTIAALGWTGSGMYSQGQTGLLFYAAEDFTSNVAIGTYANLQVTPVGSNVAVNSAQFYSNGIVTSGNVTARSFYGNIIGTNATLTSNIISNTSYSNTRIISAGGIRTFNDGTPTVNLNFGTDSIIHLWQPTGTVTLQYGTLAAGATISCFINLATARTIIPGVSAPNNINLGGQTTIGGGGAPAAKNNELVSLVYTCIDGTAANTYCVATYN